MKFKSSMEPLLQVLSLSLSLYLCSWKFFFLTLYAGRILLWLLLM